MGGEPTLFQALILAAVQGITEFLPVSSSGHLVLVRRLLGWTDAGGLAFDTVLHAGSLAALLIAFRGTVGELLAGVFRWSRPEAAAGRRLLGLLALATAPVVLAGPLLEPFLDSESLARNGVAVGLSMFATALLLWLCDLRPPTPPHRPLGVRQALLIGLMQVVALLPGASRAGWTSAGGVLIGQPREAAVRFAFLMAIPALAGALVFQLRDILGLGTAAADSGPRLALGFAVSLLTSLAAIRGCLAIVRRYPLHAFSPYLAAAGLLALVLGLRP